MKSKLYLSIILTGFFFSVCEKVEAQAPDWQWVKQINGMSDINSSNIVIDGSGNIYGTGNFVGVADFDPGPGVFNLTCANYEDIFITKSDSSGNFIWAKSMGNADPDGGLCIALDNAGNIYTTGYFSGTVDFDPGPGTFNLTSMSAGYPDIYISKSDNSGNFIWAKQIGGLEYDDGYSIKVDPSGNVYATGKFVDTVDFDPGPGTYNLTSYSIYTSNIFIVKLDSSGNFIWAKSTGGINDDYSLSLSLDNSGNVYTTGSFEIVSDFSFGNGTCYLTSAGSTDAFISKLDSAGNFVWAKQLGGGNTDGGCQVVIDASGNVYTTGTFIGAADFDPGPGTFILSTTGNIAMFISKLDSTGNFVWAKAVNGTGGIEGYSVAVDTYGNVYTTGSFNGTEDFDPDSIGTFNVTSTSQLDFFVLKLDSTGNFTWAKTAGGTGHERGTSVIINGSGNPLVYGWFGSPSITFGSTTLTNTGFGDDIFMAKLSPPTCSTSSTINPIACNSYTSPSGNYNWTNSGTYVDTIPNAAGCDSVISINLTINPLPVSLYTLYPDTTTPHNWFALNQCNGTPPLSYVWNWGDGSATSTGATPSHVYADSGYFNICVTVTDGNGCVNTYCDSSTYIYKGNSNSIITLQVVTSLPNGIEDIHGNSSINIYPVPVHDVLNVSLNKPLSANTIITISDMQGRVVGEENTNHMYGSNRSVIPINVSALSQGVYLLRIDGMVRRFVKL